MLLIDQLQNAKQLHSLGKTTRLVISVTRSGDFLDFGQFFKAFGNN